MKKIERLPPPDCWNITIPASRERLLKYYDATTVTAHWNSLEKDEKGIAAVRKQLLEMSAWHCAYCGKYIANSDMELDHYLPQAQFKKVAYSWLNFLPSCGACNRRRKMTFVPDSLQNKHIIDGLLHNPATEPPPDFVFDDHYHVHHATPDRLIDPSFDDPDEHLEFDAISCEYAHKTEIGRITIEKLFKDKDGEPQGQWSDWADHIRELVELGMSEERFTQFIRGQNYEYVGWKAYQYWSEMYAGKGILP
jgi:uncharacterized protein (TIGR02646 family)